MAKATVWRKARDVSGPPAHSPNLGRPQPRSCRPTAPCPPAVVLQFYSAMALQNLSAVDTDLVADVRASVPMDAGHRLAKQWVAAQERIDTIERNIVSGFRGAC